MDKLNPISSEDMLHAISKHEVFNGFDSAAFGNLANTLTYQTVKKNSQLFEIGDQPNLLYYLLEGALTLKFPDNSTIQLEAEGCGEWKPNRADLKGQDAAG